jgi:hypothetical protein
MEVMKVLDDFSFHRLEARNAKTNTAVHPWRTGRIS